MPRTTEASRSLIANSDRGGEAEAVAAWSPRAVRPFSTSATLATPAVNFRQP